MLIDDIRKAFKVGDDHTPKVIISGGTDNIHLMRVFEAHGIETHVKDMDENASKAGMTLSPVLFLVNEHQDHIDVDMHLPLQFWSAPINVDESVLESKDTKRITDWIAGFMYGFVSNRTVSAVDIATEKIILGSENTDIFSIANVLKSTRPKVARSELMSQEMDIGSPEEILGLTKVDVANETPVAVSVPLLDKDADARAIQQDIVDKYGMKALKDLLTKTGQPLLVDKKKV